MAKRGKPSSGDTKPLSKEFINDEDDSDGSEGSDDAEFKPDKKKLKKAKKEESEEEEDDAQNEDDESEEDEPKSSKVLKNAEGDTYVLLASSRRATIRKFKSAVLIDIRETYEKDGKDGLPGKKGISLSLDQWKTLKKAMPQIDKAIAKLT